MGASRVGGQFMCSQRLKAGNFSWLIRLTTRRKKLTRSNCHTAQIGNACRRRDSHRTRHFGPAQRSKKERVRAKLLATTARALIFHNIIAAAGIVNNPLPWPLQKRPKSVEKR